MHGTEVPVGIAALKKAKNTAWLRCFLGLHVWRVRDWDAVKGEMICSKCQKVAPMVGEVLVEWVRYRGKRRL